MASKARELANLGNAYSDGALSNRNKILNGNFDVWQRGTSFTTTGSFIYFADRWRGYNYTAGSRVDQQSFTVGQTDVPNNPKYYIRLTTGGSEYWLAQRIEDVQTCAGQTVTLSWWGRASTNTTITARTTQEFGSGGSAAVNVATQNFTFTTSWQKFTWTTDIASISGKTVGTNSFLQVWWQGNLASAGTTIDFAQVQLEVGDTSTPFEHRSIGQELALCQRYFVRQAFDDTGSSYIIGNGYWGSSTLFEGYADFPVMMRSAPSVSVANISGIRALNPQTNFYAASSFNANEVSTRGLKITWTVANSGLAKGVGGVITMQTSGSSISYDAEL